MAERLQEIFEDLMSRFIINVPDTEMSTTDRICFQIEQAHWYYEDFVREVEPQLPGYTLKRFAAEMFSRCPLLNDLLGNNPSKAMEDIYKRFMAYKMNVPVCGGIILNEKLNKILLVKGWNAKSSWTFPKGKINQDETDRNCAIREVMEETGFDISPYIRENDSIELTLRGEQRNRLFIIPNISESTPFLTQTRKEISDIKWHNLKDLPGYRHSNCDFNAQNSKYYMIRLFINHLQTWIDRYRKKTPKKSKKARSEGGSPSLPRSTMSSSPMDQSHLIKNMLGITATPPSASNPVNIPNGSSISVLKPYHSSLPSAPSSAFQPVYPAKPHRSVTAPVLDSFSTDKPTEILSTSAPKPLSQQASLLSILNQSDSPVAVAQPYASPFPVHVRPPSHLSTTSNQKNGSQYHSHAQPIQQSVTPAHGHRPSSVPAENHQQSLLNILHGTSPLITDSQRTRHTSTVSSPNTKSSQLKQLLGLNPSQELSSPSSPMSILQKTEQNSTLIENSSSNNDTQPSKPLSFKTNGKRNARSKSNEELAKVEPAPVPTPVKKQTRRGKANSEIKKPSAEPIPVSIPKKILKRGDSAAAVPGPSPTSPPIKQLSSIKLIDKVDNNQAGLANVSAQSSMSDFQFNVEDIVREFKKH